jgi:hypothetical protein
MFRGSSLVSKDSATISGDIVGGFLQVLSSIMRTNNRQGFVFWQFANTVIDFGKGLGDNIKIPRAAFYQLPTHQKIDCYQVLVHTLVLILEIKTCLLEL